MAAQLGLKKKQKQKRKATVAGADAPAVADSAAPEPEVVKKKAKRSAISGAQLAGEEPSSQQQQTADAAAGTCTSEGTAVIDPAAHKKPRRCAPTRTARLSKRCMAPVQRAVVFCTEASQLLTAWLCRRKKRDDAEAADASPEELARRAYQRERQVSLQTCACCMSSETSCSSRVLPKFCYHVGTEHAFCRSWRGGCRQRGGRTRDRSRRRHRLRRRCSPPCSAAAQGAAGSQLPVGANSQAAAKVPMAKAAGKHRGRLATGRTTLWR
jgi:hypothetical protein